MVRLSVAFVCLVAASTNAAPLLVKRIAQVISASTAKWEQACLAAGGDQQCNPLSVTAFTTLLAAAGPCEQQNAADALLSLGKQLKSNDMITLAQIFAQQPRNSPNSVAIPYCQQAPQNAELNGLFQCQFAGVNQKVFVNNVAVGGAGTIPFGLSAPLNPAGSCPAHPSGPIADGTQLVDITTVPRANGNSATAATAATTAAATTAAASQATTATTTASTDFKLANGQDAQALNAKFAALTTSSTCSTGDNACVNGGFAQCVSGKFAISQCASGLSCFALPLVNSRGTSIACDTQADALARIAATGATGGLTGSGSGSAGSSTVVAAAKTTATAASSTSTTTTASTDFKLANGQDAQALNAKFAALTTSSTCSTGDNACLNGGFAQCVGGKFAVTQCGSGLSCFALPLVNSRGTSIACDTQADALARIAATGATGGLTDSGSTSSSQASTVVAAAKAKATTAAAASTATAAASADFKLANGQDAQALNAKFAALTTSSTCSTGDNACVNGGFAQCVGGKFAITQCASGLTCFALPLVNSRGTSIACDTQADALARFAASGATGGLTGSGSTSASATAIVAAVKAKATTASSATSTTTTSTSSFALANGQDAQALNKKFAALTTASSCNAGDIACVNGGFAQCVGGKFAITQCGGGLTCVALPLVNSRGTSVTCDTKADALTRIANTGATGGLTGA